MIGQESQPFIRLSVQEIKCLRDGIYHIVKPFGSKRSILHLYESREWLPYSGNKNMYAKVQDLFLSFLSLPPYLPLFRPFVNNMKLWQSSIFFVF